MALSLLRSPLRASDTRARSLAASCAGFLAAVVVAMVAVLAVPVGATTTTTSTTSPPQVVRIDPAQFESLRFGIGVLVLFAACAFVLSIGKS